MPTATAPCACSRRLEAEGADWFGVALPEEGIELRKRGHHETDSLLGGILGGTGCGVFAT